MAINFFEAECTTQTSKDVFGIYDIPPATLDFENEDVWIAWVDNVNEIEITFIAIDKCLDIPKIEGKRSEAMITYNDTLIFIELKDANAAGWAGNARDQLVNTIKLFKRDVGLEGYKKLHAHIANKQRPNFYAGGAVFYEQFEEETGFILRVSNDVKIE